MRLAYHGGPYSSGEAHAINSDGAIVGWAGALRVLQLMHFRGGHQK